MRTSQTGNANQSIYSQPHGSGCTGAKEYQGTLTLDLILFPANPAEIKAAKRRPIALILIPFSTTILTAFSSPPDRACNFVYLGYPFPAFLSLTDTAGLVICDMCLD